MTQISDYSRRYEKVPVRIFNEQKDASKVIVEDIIKCAAKKLEEKKNLVLALDASSACIPVYEDLAKAYEAGKISFKNIEVFTIDEYYPLDRNELQTHYRFFKEYLFDLVDIPQENIHCLESNKMENVAEYCKEFDALVKSKGIDILITAGMGSNEPGSPYDSRTRVITLNYTTRVSAASDFFGVEYVPYHCITMGIGTLMEAAKVYYLAWGEGAASRIKKLVEGAPDLQVPYSFLQQHSNLEICIDHAASANLTRIATPWLTNTCEWTDYMTRKAVFWLCKKLDKPILKLTNKDYNENGLSELLALYGSAYDANIKIFNDLQHTITGWPGGKPNADDTYRPERANPFPKRVIVFSPHPDDDVISMGGTIQRLVKQGHDLHVAYETSGNIAVGDEEVTRFMHFVNGFNQLFLDSKDETIKKMYKDIKKFLANKKEGDMDTAEVRTIKGLIRRGEARTASTFNKIPLDHVHFLDLPFYESGKIEKLPMSEKDVEIVRQLLQTVKPHQIFVAGDLADPHGTHRKCTDAVLAAIDVEKEAGAEWLKDCRIWMYRGAWAEWEIENIEMCVPMSPEELRAKRNSILKHSSQMESAPFLGNDERLFWQRAEDRNRATAALYDSLGLACYEAMEAFVEYKPL